MAEEKKIINPPREQLEQLLELYRSGRYDALEKLALSITRGYPEHQFAWKLLGAALSGLGKKSAATKVFQKSIELDSKDAEAYFSLADVLRETGAFQEAEFNYRQAIDLRSGFNEAQHNLGILLEELGRLKEAEIAYQCAIASNPESAATYSSLPL